jgi:hypothetical protein
MYAVAKLFPGSWPMIQITPQMRILVCLQSIDFRKGIDGLCSVCRGVLDADPFCGALFVFRNKTRTALRILAYDGQGFWMCHKRLSNGHIGQWPQNSRIDAFELQSLIWNFQPPEGAIKFFKKLS